LPAPVCGIAAGGVQAKKEASAETTEKNKVGENRRDGRIEEISPAVQPRKRSNEGENIDLESPVERGGKKREGN